MFCKKITRQIVCAGLLLFLIGFLFALPCSAAPKGKAVVVSYDIFAMNGGDCHTAFGAGAISLSNWIHEGLARKDHEGRIVPALAKSWEMSKDGLRIKFTLNEHAKFHNGEPVTAQDVKFSIERAMRPEFKYSRGDELRRGIDRIEVVDDRHCTFYLESPLPALFELSTQHLGIIPKAYVEKVGNQEFAKHPIGAGPFKMVDYQQDVSVDLEAFEGHYRKVPEVKSIHCVFTQEDSTLMAMFKAGEADVAWLPLSAYLEVRNDPRYRILWAKFVNGHTLQFYDLYFPNEPSPFHDVRVRQAASYAVNRKAICEKVLYGSTEPWGDILAPYQPGVNLNLKTHPYDPEKARALLKEAGYPNGFDTTLPFYSGVKTESQAIASDLAKVGIRTKLIEMEFGSYVRERREKKLRGLGTYMTPWWAGQPHPGIALGSMISSANIFTYVTTPAADAAYQKLGTLNDEKEIASQAKELSRIWRESEIAYMLWAVHTPIGLSPRVKSYKPVPGLRFLVGLEYLELNE